MEYTFKKWRSLKGKFRVAVAIPVASLLIFSIYFVSLQYSSFLNEVAYKNDIKKMIALSSLRLELQRETQSMRSFYLGVQNFDHLRLQKEFTDMAVESFKNTFKGNPSILIGLEGKVTSPLKAVRDQVISGQSRWPETQKRMQEVSAWPSIFNPKYADISRIYPNEFQLDKLQEGVVSARELKNNLSFVIVRDMPLNSIQFSNLISSYERAQYLHRQVAEFLMSGADRMKFLYNQQVVMWGKISGDYEKTIETIEQGRYSIRLPSLIKRFERLEKSQMAPVELKREFIVKGAQQSLEKARTEFLFSLLWVGAFFALAARLSFSAYRRGLFYLATSFSGHEIKIITEKLHKDRIVPLHRINGNDEDYLDQSNKYIA